MIRRMFGGQKTVRPKGYDEGWKLFELGMAHASRYECEKALDYYARSISVCNNPAPYINRANILCKRIRYYEALQDLLEAKRLDKAQANEFSEILRREIKVAEAVTHKYRDGVKEKLQCDFDDNGRDYVLGKIYCASFGFHHEAWKAMYMLPHFAEYHFFNELDNIRKFEKLDLYPEALEYLGIYPEEFIDQKVADCPDVDAYRKAELTLHSFLCAYDEETMIRLRRTMLYELHQRLLDNDYPGVFGDLLDPRPEVIKEAYHLVYGEEYTDEDGMDSDDNFRIGGLSFDGDADSDDTVSEIVTRISEKIFDLAPTELDVYRYLVEEAERFSQGGQVEKSILEASGIAPLEYKGTMEKSDKYHENRVALEFLNDEVSPELDNLMGPEKAAAIRAFLFGNIVLCDENQLAMLNLRKKYAVHYCNNCTLNGHWTYHDKWLEIIEDLEARIDQIAYSGSSE